MTYKKLAYGPISQKPETKIKVQKRQDTDLKNFAQVPKTLTPLNVKRHHAIKKMHTRNLLAEQNSIKTSKRPQPNIQKQILGKQRKA